LFERNAQAVSDRLTLRHHLALSSGDLATIRRVQRAFFEAGPDIRYANPHRWFPSYTDLMLETDDRGELHSYLSSEETFQRLKRLQVNNLIVPLVGDFAGSNAVRAVGRYLRNHSATVSVFYTSNVEFYLFENGGWKNFFANVASLPLDDDSVFIRAAFNAVPGGSRATGAPAGAERAAGAKPAGSSLMSARGSTTLLDPMRAALRAYEQGLIRSYGDLIHRSDSRIAH
jgi:hypothetical protein